MDSERPEASTVARPKLDLATKPPTSFTLVVTEGPDTGKRFTIDGSSPSRVLVGQSPACEVRLADRHVSRRHVAIDVAERRLRITDLGSTNGTFVDGVAIVDAFVSGGEILRVGGTAIEVSAGEPSKAHVPAAIAFQNVIGASPEIRRLYPLCEKLAAATVPVIIEGETGTGKEALAEALHEAGPRRDGPFVVFDCTAVPANLLEAELFGHERGAFTGAVAMRKGVFEQAHGGTLLIDEIGDLELALQPKLLRVIERSEVRRVGGDRPIRVDVRILAATRRDLDHEVAAGRFRDDLFHRLAVARIELPPLRRRKGDVAVLAHHFWRAMGGRGSPPDHVLQRWEDEPWPGNVRELRNRVARLLALGDLAGADPAHAAAETSSESGSDFVEHVLAKDLPFSRARQEVMAEFERRYLERVLAAHGGNVVKAAAASGVARRYFQILRARRK